MAQYSLFVLKQTIMQEHALYNWASCGLVCSTKDITFFFRKKFKAVIDASACATCQNEAFDLLHINCAESVIKYPQLTIA